MVDAEVVASLVAVLTLFLQVAELLLLVKHHLLNKVVVVVAVEEIHQLHKVAAVAIEVDQIVEEHQHEEPQIVEAGHTDLAVDLQERKDAFTAVQSIEKRL
jgi:hypothetical protein